MATVATVEQIIAVATASKVGRVWQKPGQDEVRVYDGGDYLTLTPSCVIVGGAEIPAIAVSGRLSRRNGAAYAALRAAAEAAGMRAI